MSILGSVLVWDSALCNLSVLCVSVVVFLSKVNHRDTENTEVAQRRKTQLKTLLNTAALFDLRYQR